MTEPIEKNQIKKNLTIRISDQHRNILEEKARNRNTTISDVIRNLIDNEVKAVTS